MSTTTNKDFSSSSSSGGWHVVLLVDSQERCHPKIKSFPHGDIVREIDQHFRKFTTTNDDDDDDAYCHCETRSLLAGDYLWIARRLDTGEERVLDHLIERKTYGDLCSSVTKKKGHAHQPLSRMEVQIKKLQASTIQNTWLLLERADGAARYCRTKMANQAANHFLKEIKNGKRFPGIQRCNTKNVTETLQYLIDQHEKLRQQLQEAHEEARLLDLTKDPSETMKGLPPFSPIGTITKMNQAIKRALDDPLFQYYLTLRRVKNVGDEKVQTIIQKYPTEADMRRFLLSAGTTKEAVKELAKLDRIGKTLATRVVESFPLLPGSITAAAAVTTINNNQMMAPPAAAVVHVVTPPPQKLSAKVTPSRKRPPPPSSSDTAEKKKAPPRKKSASSSTLASTETPLPAENDKQNKPPIILATPKRSIAPSGKVSQSASSSPEVIELLDSDSDSIGGVSRTRARKRRLFGGDGAENHQPTTSTTTEQKKPGGFATAWEMYCQGNTPGTGIWAPEGSPLPPRASAAPKTTEMGLEQVYNEQIIIKSSSSSDSEEEEDLQKAAVVPVAKRKSTNDEANVKPRYLNFGSGID